MCYLFVCFFACLFNYFIYFISFYFYSVRNIFITKPPWHRVVIYLRQTAHLAGSCTLRLPLNVYMFEFSFHSLSTRTGSPPQTGPSRLCSQTQTDTTPLRPIGRLDPPKQFTMLNVWLIGVTVFFPVYQPGQEVLHRLDHHDFVLKHDSTETYWTFGLG